MVKNWKFKCPSTEEKINFGILINEIHFSNKKKKFDTFNFMNKLRYRCSAKEARCFFGHTV